MSSLLVRPVLPLLARSRQLVVSLERVLVQSREVSTDERLR